MTEKHPNQNKKRRKLNLHRVIPWTLGLLIFIAILASVIQLLKWNRGKEYVIDPNVDVDTETEDMIFFMDPSMLPENNYDGTLDVVILGNDTLVYQDGSSSIGDLLEEKIDGNVYNCGFKGSYLAAETKTMEAVADNPIDAFGFFWLSNAIMTQDWSMQETALNHLPAEYDKQEYQDTLSLLKSLDFNTIDLLLIYYDGHDYLAKHPMANPNDMYDVMTMEGSFTGSFERYPINLPHMQCIFVAPTFCYVIDENGNKEGCDIANLGHGNLPTCLTTLVIQTNTYEVSYLDNFYGIKINAETADQFLLDDGITPNKEGREMIAERIANCINIRMLKE